MSSPKKHRRLDDCDPDADPGPDATPHVRLVPHLSKAERAPTQVLSVWTAVIRPRSTRDVSPLLRSMLPIPSFLHHLKRIRKETAGAGADSHVLLRVIVATPQALTALDPEARESLRATLAAASPREDVAPQTPLEDLIEATMVPRRAGPMRSQWEAAAAVWPSTWSAYVPTSPPLESKDDPSTRWLTQLIARVATSDHTSPAVSCCSRLAVIADPKRRRILATHGVSLANAVVGADASDLLPQYPPLRHPLMLAVDAVAKGQCALSGAAVVPVATTAATTAATTDADPDADPGAHHATPPPKSGHKRRRSQPTAEHLQRVMLEEYLCAGYDVILDGEPCMMCAMAMVHSRVARVLVLRSPTAASPAPAGTTFSDMEIHCHPNLNHHYPVYWASVIPSDTA